MGKLLTGPDGGDKFTTLLFGSGIMQVHSEKATEDCKR